ncbi:MAG: hypothetical protein JSV86_17065 [Gemmatimonadota bacterium]|nr:MAG: hypothetical protein JSV86_17065 [Gemmatimonadota bacterium]
MPTRRLALVIFVALAATSCGPTAKEKALKYSLTGLNAARDGFVVWDEAHQKKIVEDATSLEEGKAALAAYRFKRERVLQSFTVAYSALAVAALDPSAEMLIEALQAAREVYTLIKTFTDGDVKTPETP